VLQHYIGISPVEGAFKACVHDVYAFVIYPGILHHHDEGGSGFEYANENGNDLQQLPCTLWLMSKGLLAYAV
jgi:hypothetical protein